MKVASWNIEGRLTLVTKKHRGTPSHILRTIKRINADVLILLEAFVDQPAARVDDDLRAMGYTWQDVQYGELDRVPPSNLYLRVLSKFKILESKQVRWDGKRNLLIVTIQDPGSKQNIRFIATHLDERSDRRRLAQLKDAVKLINSQDIPTVMLGDFNAMHDDRRSKLIRSNVIKHMLFLLPHKNARMRAKTLMEMASGDSVRFLELNTNLRDADSRHQPTTTPKLQEMEWMPSIRMAQIDHIFISPQLEALHFKVFNDGGSDHRAISANITIKSS